MMTPRTMKTTTMKVQTIPRMAIITMVMVDRDVVFIMSLM